jgi:stage II sporulation protein P
MKIDDLIIQSIEENRQNTEPNPSEIDVMWNSFQNRLNKSRTPMDTLLRGIRELYNSFSFIALIEVAAFALVLFGIPLLLNNSAFKNPSTSDTTSVNPSDRKFPNVHNLPLDIVLYNTHHEEEYTFGETVVKAAQTLSSNLREEGFKTDFLIAKDPIPLLGAYNHSRDLITENVPGYTNKILLDIHRQANDRAEAKKTILIVLSTGNPSYEKNKEFAELIVNQINQYTSVTAGIYTYNNKSNHFNQELSQYALLVEIGTEKSSKADIEEALAALSIGLGNLIRQN